MTPSRDTVEHALRADATRPVPSPTPGFVDALEQRLLRLSLDTPPVARRRIARVSGVGALIGTLTFVGAAAAAGIVISTRTDAPDRSTATDVTEIDGSLPAGATDRPTDRESVPSLPGVSPVDGTTDPNVGTEDVATVSAPVGGPPPTASSAPASAPPPVAPTTAAPANQATSTVAPATPTVAPAPPTTAGPAPATTVPPPPEPTVEPAPTTPPTAPPTTAAPTTAPPPAVAPTTTEVTTPATMSLSCATSVDAVRCSWSAGPDGTTRYLVLRSIPGSGTPGRAFAPAPGSLTYVDTTAVPGTTYTYLVHAFADGPQSIAHSPGVTVACCS